MIIDETDADLVANYSWALLVRRGRKCVRTFARSGHGYVHVYLHHILVPDRREGREVHFANGNTLDLRRANLVVVPRGASRRGLRYRRDDDPARVADGQERQP